MAKKPAKSKAKKKIQAIPAFDVEGAIVEAPEADDAPASMDDVFGPAITIVNDDDSVTIEFGSNEEERPEPEFEDNLAEHINETELKRIASDLLEQIEQDDRDRSEWLTQRADGLELLGTKVEKPGGGAVGTSSTAVPGQSTVRDGILNEAVIRFQANSFAELCPSEGPVKVMNYSSETFNDDKLAEDLEKDMNFYLTGSGGSATATEYYPDTRNMLWWVGYASGMFKKVYNCPLRGRPVSESVDGSDLIVPSTATNLHNARRITHQMTMGPVVLKRMQVLGEYRNVPLQQPSPHNNALVNKEADVVGMNPNQSRPEDQDYTIYECYCDLDIPDFEHKDNKGPTGLPVPYIVVIDKDSQTVLSIKRNWEKQKDGEEDKLPKAKIPFVLFPYVTGLGFYGQGLLHQLGNYTTALTAMLRECIDAGMFASFPGFLFAKPMGRQLQNEFRVPPGGGAPIDVSATGNDITKAVMPLPYKDVSQAMVGLMAQTREQAARYGGMAESPTGEGVINAPVGSVLAAIDQATRIEGGVHKALYAAQREEFGLLFELFKDDPEPLWAGNPRPAMGADPETRKRRWDEATKHCSLTPASDPNVPSHMHRLAKASTYLQTAMAVPGIFDMRKVLTRWAAMVRIDDIEADFLPAQPPMQPPPLNPLDIEKLRIDDKNADTRRLDVVLKHQGTTAKLQSDQEIAAAKMAEGQVTALDQSQTDPLQERALDLKQQQLDQNAHKIAVDAHQKHAELNSKESVEALKLVNAAFVHPESQGVASQEMEKVRDIIAPAADNNHRPTQAPFGLSSMAAGGPVRDNETVLEPDEIIVLSPYEHPYEDEIAQTVVDDAAYRAQLDQILHDYLVGRREKRAYIN
jgi:hypothetical protein